MRLVCNRTALAPITIPLVGFPLHRNVLCWASIVIPLSGMALHGYALRKLSIARLDIHVELLVQQGLLLVELASRLREFVKPRTPLGVGAAVARSRLRFGAARHSGHADVALPRGSWRRTNRALRVVVDPGAAPVVRRPLT
jgi:hypothetical protein